MDTRLRISLIIGIIFFGCVIIYFLERKKLHLKYTLIWLGADLVMLLAVIFNKKIEKIAAFVGVKTPVNFVFVVFGLFALMIILMLTGIVSHMNARIFSLVQAEALLEERVRELETNQEKDKINEEEGEKL